MKSRISKLSLVVIVVLALAISLFACSVPQEDEQNKEYTITYAAGEGATGSYEAGTYEEGATVTLPDGTALTKENYTFDGWTDGTTNYAAGATYTMPANDVTLTAVWKEVSAVEPTTYTLTYAAGEGATGSYDAGTYAEGATVTLPDGTALTKEGYTFDGWTDGTTNYAAGATYTMPANDVTLTAAWKEVSAVEPTTYTLTYAAGEGATGTYAAGTYTKGATVTLPDGAALSKADHTFNGWTDGTTNYAAGATYTMPESNVTLTAVWVENTYTLTYAVGEGATGTYAAGTYTKGATVTLPDGAALSKENYTFDGWTDGTTDYAAGATYTMPANNVTITAKWAENASGNPTYTNNAGVTVNNHTIDSIEYNATDSTILVKYDAGSQVTYNIHLDSDGTWAVDSFSTIFGYSLGWLEMTDAELKLCNWDGAAIATFYIGGVGEGGGNEGGNEGGDEGDEATDVIKVFVYEGGATINGHTVTQIKYNQTKATITVTYDGAQTVTYKLSDWGDGDWKVDNNGDNLTDKDTVFGENLYCVSISATTFTVDLSGWGAVDVDFTLEGAGGNEGDDTPDQPTGEDIDKTYEIVTAGPYATTQVAGNTINKLVYNAAKATIVVTYNGTQTATYTLKVGNKIYDLLDAYTIVETDHIFTAEFLGFVIEDDNIGLYVGYNVLNFALATAGGDDNEGGEVAEDVINVYANPDGETSIIKIEHNATQNTIIVTAGAGVWPSEYVFHLTDAFDGDWEITNADELIEAKNLFGTDFAYVNFAEAGKLKLSNVGCVSYLTFTLEGNADEDNGNGGEGGDASGAPVYTNGQGVEVNGHIITAIEYNAANAAILVTYDAAETATYIIEKDYDGTWVVMSNEHIFGWQFGWIEITDTELSLCGYTQSGVLATFYIDGNSEQGGNEGNEGGNEGEASDLDVYTNPDGDTSVTQIEYNAAQNTITVTAGAGVWATTYTFHLTDAGDGDWTINDPTELANAKAVFGEAFAYVNFAQAGKLSLTNAGCVAYITFTLEGGAGEDNGNEGGVAEDVINVYSNPTGDTSVTQIKHNATQNTLTVTAGAGVWANEYVFHLTDAGDGDWEITNADELIEAQNLFGIQFAYVNFAQAGKLRITNAGFSEILAFTLEESSGEDDAVINVYTNPDGDTSVTQIEYNSTQNTITVTSGAGVWATTYTFHLTDAGDGDWTIDNAEELADAKVVFGTQFAYVNFAQAGKLSLTNAGFTPYLTFALEGGAGEDNGNESGEAEAVINVYTNPDGDTTISKIEHNATQNTVTVTAGAGVWATEYVFHLTDAGDGDWTIDDAAELIEAKNLFGTQFAYINFAQAGKLNLTNAGFTPYLTFTLEGATGGNTGEGASDAINVYADPDGDTTISKIEHNVAQKTITVTAGAGVWATTYTFHLTDAGDGDWTIDDAAELIEAKAVFGEAFAYVNFAQAGKLSLTNAGFTPYLTFTLN